VGVEYLHIPTDIREDKGIRGLSHELKRSEAWAVGSCVLLFCVMLDHCPTGSLTDCSDFWIENTVGWDGRRRRFAKAFRNYMCDADGVCPLFVKHNRVRLINAEWQRRRKRMDVQALYERDDHKCVVCGTSEDLSLDHIFPKSRGGSHEPENLQTMCRPCNASKGARL
jgi:hypothetical protein